MVTSSSERNHGVDIIKRILGLAAVTAAAAAALLLPATQASAATPAIMITKVYVNAPGTDTSSNTSVNGEYVVVKNTTKGTLNLKSWTLRDQSAHVYTFPNVNLGAGRTFTIHSGKGTNNSTTLYWGTGWHIWNNTGGDGAYLRNTRNTTIDTCIWPGSVASYVNC